VRADDQPRPHDGGAPAQRLGDHVLGAGLERAVEVAVGLAHVGVVGRRDDRLGARDLVGGGARRGRALVGGDAGAVAVHRQRGDERVVRHAPGEQPGRRPRARRQVGAGVDGRVPGAALERAEVAAIPVAAEMLHAGEGAGVAAAPAMKERDGVAARPGGVDQVAAHEAGATQDQDPHAAVARPSVALTMSRASRRMASRWASLLRLSA